MHTLTQYEVAWNMKRAGSDINTICHTVGKDRSTIYRWLSSIRLKGIKQFLKDKKTAKHRRPSRRTPEYIVEIIVDIRNNLGYCGFKIQKELREVHGIKRSIATIYRILHDRFTKYAVGVKKYHKHKAIVTANGPREVIEHDTVDLGGKYQDEGGKYKTAGLYAHTTIDIFTKEPTVTLVTDLTQQTSTRVFKEQKAYYGKALLHQTDNGSEFQEDFVKEIEKSGSKHRYSRPYKKNEQAHIENFNKALRSECFPGANYNSKDIEQLQEQADEFVDFFVNKRWHMGLPDAMTPKQFKDCYNDNPKSAKLSLTAWQQRYSGDKQKCRICG